MDPSISFGTIRWSIAGIAIGQGVITAYYIGMYMLMLGVTLEDNPPPPEGWLGTCRNTSNEVNQLNNYVNLTESALLPLNKSIEFNKNTSAAVNPEYDWTKSIPKYCLQLLVLLIHLAYLNVLVVGNRQNRDSEIFWGELGIYCGVLCVLAALFITASLIFLLIGLGELHNPEHWVRKVYTSLEVFAKFLLVQGILRRLILYLSKNLGQDLESIVDVGSFKNWFWFLVFHGIVSHMISFLFCLDALVWIERENAVAKLNSTWFLVSGLVLTPDLSLQPLDHYFLKPGNWIRANDPLVYAGFGIGCIWHFCNVYVKACMCYAHPAILRYMNRRALWRTCRRGLQTCWSVKVLMTVVLSVAKVHGWFKNLKCDEFQVHVLVFRMSVHIFEVAYAMFYDGIVLLVTGCQFLPGPEDVDVNLAVELVDMNPCG